ncbi:MAG TPA: hypothetical protein VFA59_03200 [Vicinamibacterales bacterium]|nr:hypothetical protein [Vicinamibacterales bacterium]
MELHRPHEHSPFGSWKAFLVEIATIVIGVLIALSFEGAREWYRDRSLGAEARDTIVRELTANRNAINEDITTGPKRQHEVETALQYTKELLETGKTSLKSIGLNFNYGELRRSSWQTAAQTGALTHMSFGDVQKYAAAYDLQDVYQTQQRRGIGHYADALTSVAAGIDPGTAKKPDLERFREHLLTLGADLYMEDQLAHQLRDRYDKVLKE